MQNLKYKIGLCNVFWNKNGIDTKYFNNVEAQKNYFLNKINGGANLSPLVNFNINDNITTVVTYQDNSERTIEELIACNYAVILKYNTDTNEIINTRYFFAKVSQLSGRQMRVELDLDDLQTNYVRYKNNIAPCIINRAHLNRFIDNGDNTISFNLSPESHLFEEENETKSKRLIKREKIKIKYHNDDIINDWLNENVVGWVYTFLDKNKSDYNIFKYSDNAQTKISGDLFDISYFGKNASYSNVPDYSSEYSVIFYPMTKRGNIQIRYNSELTTIDSRGEANFRQRNNNTSFYFSSKISAVVPIDFNQLNCTINNGDLIIDLPATSPIVGDKGRIYRNETYVLKTGKIGTNPVGVFAGAFGTFEYECLPINIEKKLSFNKNDLINSQRDLKYNPKLLNTNFYNLTLKSADGSEFDYDILKINNITPKLIYNETLQAEITKYYFRIDAPNGLYIEKTKENYTGLVGAVDNSIPIANDQYSNFIANNKNFNLQAMTNFSTDMLKALKNVKNPINLIENTFDASMELVNKGFTTDNMKSAPGQLQKASGNVLFNLDVCELGLYYELYECLEHDKQQADDIMYKNGFVYGEIGNIADFDNIRAIFNYISADVDGINANISDEEKTRLIEKLKSVRFWNIDGFDYINENYERSIANG